MTMPTPETLREWAKVFALPVDLNWMAAAWEADLWKLRNYECTDWPHVVAERDALRKRLEAAERPIAAALEMMDAVNEYLQEQMALGDKMAGRLHGAKAKLDAALAGEEKDPFDRCPKCGAVEQNGVCLSVTCRRGIGCNGVEMP